jgi:uncharacterized membrane protein YcaP (DUF421 family)
MPSLYQLFDLSKEQAHHTLWFVALETFILLVIFMVLTELAGRKTVAQMTMLQMIITIGIGESLLMPVVDKDFSLIKTVVIVAVMVGFLIFNEWLEVKFNWFERLFTPKAKIVIDNGKIDEKNLGKLRMTVDQLEMYLREVGIQSISHVKTATIEANGRIGYQLIPERQFFTVKDMKDIQKNNFPDSKVEGDIFQEIKDEASKIKNKKPHNKKLK